MGNILATYSSRFNMLAVAMIIFSIVFTGAVSADTSAVSDEVIIIGKGFVQTIPDDTGVILESKKGKFEPVRFDGLEGTAAMLFLYNRITRDMGVDLLSRTYKVERGLAATTVDSILQFYRDKELIFKSRFEERPATKVGIVRFRV